MDNVQLGVVLRLELLHDLARNRTPHGWMPIMEIKAIMEPDRDVRSIINEAARTLPKHLVIRCNHRHCAKSTQQYLDALGLHWGEYHILELPGGPASMEGCDPIGATIRSWELAREKPYQHIYALSVEHCSMRPGEVYVNGEFPDFVRQTMLQGFRSWVQLEFPGRPFYIINLPREPNKTVRLVNTG